MSSLAVVICGSPKAAAVVARREADVKSNIPKFVSVSDDAIVGVARLLFALD